MLTSEVPIAEIFTGEDPVKLGSKSGEEGHGHIDSGMRSLMDDLGISMNVLLESSIFVCPLMWDSADVDWRGGKVCFCTGIVKVSADGE